MSYNKDTGLYEGYIYKIINDINNKIYIGQTTRTVELRWRSHLLTCKKDCCDTYFHQVVHNLGMIHFKPIEIEKIVNISKDELLKELNKKEIYYIRKFNSIRPNGYNTAKGGYNLPNTYMEKSVYQFSLIGELIAIYKSMANASEITGTQQSDISKCCNGVIKSANGFVWSFNNKFICNNNPHQKPIDVYTINGEFLETLMKQGDAIKYTHSKNISKLCSGKLIQSNGYVFRYHGEPFDLYRINYNNNSEKVSKKVNKYDINGNYISTYSSITSAGKELGVKNVTSISKCCKYKNKTSYGYKWFYANDPNQPDKSKIIV